MLHFTVRGIARAKARPRVTRAGSYTPAQTTRFEAQVGWEARVAMVAQRQPMLSGPLALAIVAFLPAPAADPALVGQPHTGKPDADNLWKAVADAMQGVVYSDDSRVAMALAIKLWCLRPDACTRVWVGQWTERRMVHAAALALATA